MRVEVGLFGLSLLGIAWIAVPNLLAARQRAKLKQAMSDVRSIGTAVESFQVDNGSCPAADSLERLAAMVEPTFIRVLPRLDPWGVEYRYQAWRVEGGHLVPGEPNVYVVRSAGSDRVWLHEDVVDYEYGPWPDGLALDGRGDILYGGVELVNRGAS